MELDSPAWISTWSHTPQRSDHFRALLAEAGGADIYCGTDEEPHSSVWLASLSAAMGDGFREQITVLDYGCGTGRYAHFLRQRLRRFTYYGLERPGSQAARGEKCIEAATAVFAGDSRCRFDLIGSSLENEAIDRADIALLGSVFTHTNQSDLYMISRKLAPIARRGGQIVFSVFLAHEYRLEDAGIYGFTDCYGRAFFTRGQLATLGDELQLKLFECEQFIAQQVNVHCIFTARARESS
jgi:SAM-dependent methyltransferase